MTTQTEEKETTNTFEQEYLETTNQDAKIDLKIDTTLDAKIETFISKLNSRPSTEQLVMRNILPAFENHHFIFLQKSA